MSTFGLNSSLIEENNGRSTSVFVHDERLPIRPNFRFPFLDFEVIRRIALNTRKFLDIQTLNRITLS